MKCCASLSSFVNMSAKLTLPSICRTCMKSDRTDSLTAFSRICMCLSPFVVEFFDQHTAALLSLYTLVLDGISSSCKFRPLIICSKYRRYFVHSSTAYISASAELLAVIVCLFDIQCIGPDNHNRKPEIDLDLNISTSSGLEFLPGFF